MPRPTPEVERLEPYSAPSAGRRGFLRLDFNENLLGPSPRVIARLRAVDPDDVALYPDETEARAAVAQHFGIDGALDLVLTSGVDEGIRLICDAFVSRGDEVIVVEPGYAMYRFYATLAGARITAATSGEDLGFPEGAVRERMAGGAKLVILGDPNNPTGKPIPGGVIEDLARSYPGTLILADEAYADFAGGSSLALLPHHPNLIVARTFSKAYGLAGLRVGVLLARMETLSWIARMRSPYAVTTLALAALTAALDDTDYVQRYVTEVKGGAPRSHRGLGPAGNRDRPQRRQFSHRAGRRLRRPAARESARQGCAGQSTSLRSRSMYSGAAPGQVSCSSRQRLPPSITCPPNGSRSWQKRGAYTC